MAAARPARTLLRCVQTVAGAPHCPAQLRRPPCNIRCCCQGGILFTGQHVAQVRQATSTNSSCQNYMAGCVPRSTCVNLLQNNAMILIVCCGHTVSAGQRLLCKTDRALSGWLGTAFCELRPVRVIRMQLHALYAVVVLFGNLPGLASELVRGGVLQELLRLVRHPLSECRNDACDDNMAEENCDAIVAGYHTTDMVELAMLMFDVLRGTQLPQVRPRLALAAVQLCMRCPSPC